MDSILIKNVTIVNPGSIFAADVFVRDFVVDKIAELGSLDLPDGKVIDGTGQYLIPSGIDPHVHLQLPTPAGPSCDDFELGGRAAIAGGTGALIDFVTPMRGESLIEAYLKRKKESESCSIPVKLHVGITWWSASVAEEIEDLVNQYDVHSFKIYLAYLDSIGLSFAELREAMKCIANAGAIAAIHAEEGDRIKLLQQRLLQNGQTEPKFHAISRPADTEYHAVRKVIDLVRETRCVTYLVHMSTAESVAMIKAAKAEGLPLFAETCPQYLLLDESVYEKPEPDVFAYILSPPIRTSADSEALWHGLADGSIDCVSTDHCPFTLAQKMAGKINFTQIPNGAGSLQYRLSLLFTFGVLKNRISLQQWVQLCSSNAAQIFGFHDMGSISEKSNAKVVLWNPNVQSVIQIPNPLTQADIHIFNNFTIFGQPVTF